MNRSLTPLPAGAAVDNDSRASAPRFTTEAGWAGQALVDLDEAGIRGARYPGNLERRVEK